MIRGSFRAARAHRLPDGIEWKSVLRCRTVDATDGTLIVEVHPMGGGAPESVAGARLVHVADIQVEIQFVKEHVDRSVGFGSRTPWADMVVSDGEASEFDGIYARIKGDQGRSGGCG